MGDNRDLVVVFDKEDTSLLIEWKKSCLGKNGSGGIKKRVVEFVKEDLKKLNSEKEKKR